ncbi:MAG: phosphatidylglycerophosphatase A [bacterium]|nr:phosphatidylglycerophosphatase A [bacterium]
MNAIERVITTVVWTGYSPIAPATVASAVVCVILWFVPGAQSLWMLLPLAVLTLIGVWLTNRFIDGYSVIDPGKFAAVRRKNPKRDDPDPVVFDELVGQWITLLAAPHTVLGFAAAFFLFRFFDIFKILGTNRLQKLPRGWGVMLDDVAAGVWAALALALLRYWFPGLLGMPV